MVRETAGDVVAWIGAIVIVFWIGVRFFTHVCSYRHCWRTPVAEWMLRQGGLAAGLVHGAELFGLVLVAVVAVVVCVDEARDRLP